MEFLLLFLGIILIVSVVMIVGGVVALVVNLTVRSYNTSKQENQQKKLKRLQK